VKRWLLVIAACGAPQPPPAAKYAAATKVEPVANHVTLVDFWSESCEACVVVGGMIAVKIAKDDRVIVRKIDVGDGFTPIAKQYDIATLPHWDVYDTKQRLRYRLIGPECLRAPELAAELLHER
jgi:thiol-disulfide isomerase/thioredoxin